MTQTATLNPELTMNTLTPQRRTLPRWAQCGVLLLVFASGGIVGAMVAAQSIHSRMNYYRENPEALPAVIVPKLQQQLSLTDEQVAKVKEIIVLRHPRMVEFQQQGAQAMLNEFKLLEDEVVEVLEKEQKGLWREVTKTVRERYLPRSPSRASTPDRSEGQAK